MSENSNAGQTTPKHLWVVGILALLWNAMGCFDYFMSQTRNEGYMSNFTAEQLEYFYGFPAWAVGTWAIAVWGGLLGAILLLLRKKLATRVFLVSLIAMVITNVYSYVLSNGMDFVSGNAFAAGFALAIFVFGLLSYLYARAMEQRGVLG
jgi:hypothetical protein